MQSSNYVFFRYRWENLAFKFFLFDPLSSNDIVYFSLLFQQNSEEKKLIFKLVVIVILCLNFALIFF